MAVTVQPAVNYHGLGGSRIKDVVHLVAGANEMITAAPYRREIH
jgi:Xaa-Pro aminopeptidase